MELLVEVKRDEEEERCGGGEEDNADEDVNVSESDRLFLHAYVQFFNNGCDVFLLHNFFWFVVIQLLMLALALYCISIRLL